MLPRHSSSLSDRRDEILLTTAEHALRLVEVGDPEAQEPATPTQVMEQLVAELREYRRRTKRIAVKTTGKVVFVRADEIDWVEAAGNYVKLHMAGEALLFRESMKNMEARLDNEQFVRIHRSVIVNLDRIRELQPWFHGEYVVILRDGTRMMASRVFSDRLHRLIG